MAGGAQLGAGAPGLRLPQSTRGGGGRAPARPVRAGPPAGGGQARQSQGEPGGPPRTVGHIQVIDGWLFGTIRI